MPELADVEHFKRFFSRHAAGKKVAGVWVDPTILRNATPEALEAVLRRHRFEEPDRLGKWLICPTDGPVLLLHFGMTGDLVWSEHELTRHPHDRLILEFAGGGELRYRNMRKFGGVAVARRQEDIARLTGPLGPDALDVGREEFHELLSRRRGSVKAALMDQKLIAGLGNLLCDEIAWRAGVRPATPLARLGARRRDCLYDSMTAVLRESIPRGRIPPDPGWLTGARDERPGSCPRCGGRLKRATIAGRTTCWCPSCQR